MIHIITTGGTIEGLDYEKPENKQKHKIVYSPIKEGAKWYPDN